MMKKMTALKLALGVIVIIGLVLILMPKTYQQEYWNEVSIDPTVQKLSLEYQNGLWTRTTQNNLNTTNPILDMGKLKELAGDRENLDKETYQILSSWVSEMTMVPYYQKIDISWQIFTEKSDAANKMMFLNIESFSKENKSLHSNTVLLTTDSFLWFKLNGKIDRTADLMKKIISTDYLLVK